MCIVVSCRNRTGIIYSSVVNVAMKIVMQCVWLRLFIGRSSHADHVEGDLAAWFLDSQDLVLVR